MPGPNYHDEFVSHSEFGIGAHIVPADSIVSRNIEQLGKLSVLPSS
jgi:hypothetical protein